MPQAVSSIGQPRPTSANQPPGPRWPAMQALVSTWAATVTHPSVGSRRAPRRRSWCGPARVRRASKACLSSARASVAWPAHAPS
eukprot:scaffold66847_cov57-Phaeocystis_antarctica.AAC.2